MHRLSALPLLVLGAASAMAQTSTCPNSAVSLALKTQVRGYSVRSNGIAVPCQVIAGSNSAL